jgi:hypothetical protein
MKRLISLALSFVLVVALTGCSPVEQNARNVLAANYGLLTTAFQQYNAECSTDPSGYACTLIVKDAQAQNAGIIALEAYCGFTSASLLTDKCVPVKSAEAGLVAALANINAFMAQVKVLVGPTTAPTPTPSPATTQQKG